MADIARYPLIRHLRSEPNRPRPALPPGRVAATAPASRSGSCRSAAVVEVPLDDRELPFLRGPHRGLPGRGRERRGHVPRARPRGARRRVDFTLDPTGRWTKAPLDKSPA